MLMNELNRATKRIRSKDHGRGGKRGKTSGRGTKGQNARAGRKFRPEMRDAIKKLPKLRGYRFNSHVVKSVAINLSDLSKFEKGDTVTPKTLVEKSILSKVLGKYPVVKILSTGEITMALNFEECHVSKQAIEKIEKAGGKVEIKKNITNKVEKVKFVRPEGEEAPKAVSKTGKKDKKVSKKK